MTQHQGGGGGRVSQSGVRPGVGLPGVLHRVGGQHLRLPARRWQARHGHSELVSAAQSLACQAGKAKNFCLMDSDESKD